MLTAILVVAAVLVVIGVVFLVLNSGQESKRSGQSGKSVATGQVDRTAVRGNVRSSGNDD